MEDCVYFLPWQLISLFSYLGLYGIPCHPPWDESGSRHWSKRLWVWSALYSERAVQLQECVFIDWPDSPGVYHAWGLLLEIRGYLLGVFSVTFFFWHRKLPCCFQSSLAEITLFSLCILFSVHLLYKGSHLCLKTGLSEKVFVMTKMKSENG